MNQSTLTSLLEPLLAHHGLELDTLDVTPVGKRRLLRVTVDGDGPEGNGPLLDDIAAASKAISLALDETNVMGDAPYTLEVSTRGVSKPLTEPKHFRRNAGRLVRVWTAADDVTGRIVGVTDDEVELDLEPGERTFALADITKAVVQVELNRPAPELDDATDSEEA